MLWAYEAAYARRVRFEAGNLEQLATHINALLEELRFDADHAR